MKFKSILVNQTEALLKFLKEKENEKTNQKKYTSRDIFNLPDFELKKAFEGLLNSYGEDGLTYSGFLNIKNKVFWILTKAE